MMLEVVVKVLRTHFARQPRVPAQLASWGFGAYVGTHADLRLAGCELLWSCGSALKSTKADQMFSLSLL
jgi:hypothetical protein